VCIYIYIYIFFFFFFEMLLVVYCLTLRKEVTVNYKCFKTKLLGKYVSFRRINLLNPELV
jgi:hypothetical protein